MHPHVAANYIATNRKNAEKSLLTILATLAGVPQVVKQFEQAVAVAPAKQPDFDVTFTEAQVEAYAAIEQALLAKQGK